MKINQAFLLLTTTFADILAKSDVYELLEVILKRSYAEIVLGMDDVLTSEEIQTFNQVVSQLKTGYPVAYITRRKFFYKDYFYVNQNVLIPREETSLMVEIGLDFLKTNYLNHQAIYYDFCTGSGNVGLSIQKYFPNLMSYLTDNSFEALEVAQSNQIGLNLTDVNFIHGDFLSPLLNQKKFLKANLITVNPPYIDSNDPWIAENVEKYEPHNALFAPNQGLFFYQAMAEHYYEIVDKTQKFLIIMEFGANQKAEIEAIFTKKVQNDTKINFIQDTNNHYRFITISN